MCPFFFFSDYSVVELHFLFQKHNKQWKKPLQRKGIPFLDDLFTGTGVPIGRFPLPFDNCTKMGVLIGGFPLLYSCSGNSCGIFLFSPLHCVSGTAVTGQKKDKSCSRDTNDTALTGDLSILYYSQNKFTLILAIYAL